MSPPEFLIVAGHTFKLIAAKGNVQMQAQDGQIEATAQNDVIITSVNGKVVIQAPKEILLTAGGGYIRIGADIEIHNPGTQSQKAGSFSLSGSTSQIPTLAQLPKLDVTDQQFHLVYPNTDIPLSYVPYRITTESGKIIEGITDVNGYTSRIQTTKPEHLDLEILQPENEGHIGDTL